MNYVVTHYPPRDDITMDMMQAHIKYLIELFGKGKLIMTGLYTDKAAGGMFVIKEDSFE